MQVWNLEKEDTPHSFSSKVFLHYYKFYFSFFYSLFCLFIFVNFYFKIIITVLPFPCFICTARHWWSAIVMTIGDISLDDHIHSWYVCIWGWRYRHESLGWACMVTLSKIHYMPGNPMEGMYDIYKKPHFSLMQSNPTHPLGRNQSPSPEKKLGVQRRPQRTPYPQEESLQHLAVDHITGVNASRGPIQSRLATTPD